MLANRRHRSSRSRIARNAAPIWQSFLDWLPGESARRKSATGHGRRRLGIESLEERTVLTTNIDFNAGTGILTLTAGAAETVNLDVASVADFNITSDAGTTISGDAGTIGFTAGGANIISDGSLAAVNRIDIVGSAGVQTVNFNGGVFAATTVVDGAQDIENVNFSAATTFSKVLGSAPTADLNVTAATSLTQSAGATITATDGGNIVLTTNGGNLAVNAAISSVGGNGNVSLSAANSVTAGASVSVVGSGDITINADSDNSGTGVFSSTVGGTLVTAGGDVTVTAQDVDLQAAVNAGLGRIELQTQTGGTIDLGADGATADDFGLTNADLNLLTAATVQIGDAAAGNITVTAPLTILPVNVPTLSLVTGAGITENVGATISVANLAISAGAAAALQQSNDVDNLAANIATAGSTFAFVDVDGLNISTVDGVAGITTTSTGTEFVRLQTGGALTQGAGAAITTSGLVVAGAGPVTLNLSTNNVATFAANTTGSISYRDADALVVGTVNGTAGITTTDDDVSLQTGGTLALSQAVALGLADLTLNVAAAATQTASITASGLELLGAGPYTLNLNTNNVANIAANATGAINYRDADALVVGTVNGTVGITTTDDDVSLQTGGTLALSQAVALGLGDLTLNAAAAATQTASVTASGLELLGAGPYTLNLATNNVANIAANATGAISYRDANALVVGTVNGTAGITTSDDDVSLQTGGTLALSQAVALGLGDLTLNAAAAATQTASVTASGLELLGAGPYTLNLATNDVANLAANATGAISYHDANALVVGTVNGTAGITTSDDDVSLQTGGTLALSQAVALGLGDLTLNAAAAATQTASVTASGLELLGAGPYTLTLATNNVANIAANATGAISYRDADALVVGTVNGTAGITTSDNDVSLQTGGTLALSQAVAAGLGDLTLNAAAAATQTASITASGLELLGAGPYTLNLATNNVANIAANATGAISYRDADALVVGTVNGTAGITTSDDDVSLRTGGTLSVNQAVALGLGDLTLNAAAAATQTASVTASGLELLGAGPYTLNLATNDVANLAANATGAISYRDANALVVGTVNGTVGVTTSDDDVSLQTGGTLTVNQAVALGLGDLTLNAAAAATQTASITASGLELLGAGPFTLNLATNNVANIAANATGAVSFHDANGLTVGTVNATTGLTANGAVSLAADTGVLTVDDAVSSGGANVTLSTNDLAVNAAINAGAGIATVQQAGVTLRNIDLGTNTAGSLGLTDAELDLIAAAVLRVGRVDNAGNISISDSITPDLATTLDLLTGGGIIDATAGEQADVTVANLALLAAAGIGTADEIDTAVSTLAASNTTSGNINVSDGGALTIGVVDGVTGAVNSAVGGQINVSAQNALTVANNVSAAGNVGLTAGASAAAGDNLTVNAGTTVQSTADVALTAGDLVLVPVGATVQAAGSLALTGGSGEVDGGGGVTVQGALAGTTATISGGAGADVITLNPTSAPALISVLGLAGDDTFNITPNATTAFNIDGGDPSVAVGGDTLNVDFSGTTGMVFTPGVLGAGQFSFTNRQQVNFAGIESLATVSGAEGTIVLVPDILVPGQNSLVVTGTSGNDRIVFDLVNHGTQIRARIIKPGPDVTMLVDAATVDKIVAFGLAGNDSISVSSRISIKAELSGGAGKDHIQGGSGDDILRGDADNDVLLGGKGNDVLLGGDGNDVLHGQTGNDIMIGGLGKDTLTDGSQENVFIGGTTSLDSNDAALLSLMATWANLALTFQQRTDALRLLLHPDPLATVFDDATVDHLVGGAKSDFFLDFALADKTNFKASRDRLN